MSINKKVLIKHIAEAVSCSPSTVSIVLGKKGDKYRISQSRQEEIFSTAENMGYFSSKPDGLRSRKDTLVIAIFISGFDYLPLRNMLHGMSEYPTYGDKRLDFSLHPYQPNHLYEYESIFTDKRYDGVIFVPSSEVDLAFLEKSNYDFPCSIMTRIVKNYNSVTTNRYESGEATAKIFIAHGHSHVAILRKNDSSKSGLLRSFGFISTYESSDIPDKNVTVIEAEPTEDGYAAMNRLIAASPNLPDAVFIAEPFMLSEVLRSVHDNNITLPDDMELITFGDYADSSLSECLYPSITTIGFPVKQMMIDSIDLLCRQIHDHSLRGVIRELPVEVKFRDSCPRPDNWEQ